MNQPNFFIVGAPKAGTTSLYRYLGYHPNVFMSKIKGPHYFATDIVDKRRIVKTKEDYRDLFKLVKKNHKCTGEASVLYLYSKDAIKNIYKNYPDSKLIVLLRNPLEIVQSWHAEKVWACNEEIEDLELAWEMNLKPGKKAQKYKNDVFDYSGIAMFGEQIKILLNYFPKKNVKIITFNDFCNHTENTYNEVLDFLNLPPYKINDFTVNNAYKRYKNKWIQKILTNPPKNFLYYLEKIKSIFGIKRLNFMSKILRFNTYNPSKPPMSNKFRQKIINNYYDDIYKLSKILDKDFIKIWFSK